MNNFIYHNPTELVFGKGQIARLAKLIPADKRIMITFGGGSVKRNGVYEQVMPALEGREVVEFWGIEANPSVETLRRAIALGKERRVDFLLAVGGGSVIDGTKLIAAGLLYEGDAWEIVLKGKAGKTVPLATVLTMSATGSEMNNGAVIFALRDEGEVRLLRGLSCLFDPRSRDALLPARAADRLRTFPIPSYTCWSSI